jgi:hypothetical protein
MMRALGRCRRPPGREGRLGGGDRLLDGRLVRHLDLADHLAGRRVVDRLGRPARDDDLAVDQVTDGLASGLLPGLFCCLHGSLL